MAPEATGHVPSLVAHVTSGSLMAAVKGSFQARWTGESLGSSNILEHANVSHLTCDRPRFPPHGHGRPILMAAYIWSAGARHHQRRMVEACAHHSTPTAAAIPGVVLRIADGIVRIAAGIIRAAARLS
jgi:hypothetical protein